MLNTKILSNPYANIGKLHNTGLEYVLGSLSDNPTIKEIIDLSSQYLQTLSYENSKINGDDYYVIIAETMNRLEIVPFEDFLISLVGMKLITYEGIEFIKEIDAIKEDSEDIYGQIVLIENKIYVSGMSIEEQRFPLLFAAVAKSSSQYMPPNRFISKFHWPWKADAHGAIAGAVGGATAGTFIGGLLGALAGGIGESLAVAILGD